MLKKVTIKDVINNETPEYIKTNKVVAERDGKEFGWEIAVGHDSVHIMVNNVEKNTLELVRQVRIPVLVNNPTTDGTCYECCAGLVDKDLPLVQIAQEEVLEELGYEVETKNMSVVRHFLSSVGSRGGNIYTYTVNVNESMRVSEGGGLNDEDIEVISIPYEDVSDFIYGYGDYKDARTDATTLFLLLDWLHNSRD